MKVLVIGSGGREHTIAWRLAQSNLVSEVICVPGNGGTATESKCKNIDPKENADLQFLSFNDVAVTVAKKEKVDFAVIARKTLLQKELPMPSGMQEFQLSVQRHREPPSKLQKICRKYS